ncbi:hypothetical protein [uncultured Veillonella sp.]|uniref:hypothetical protein n=1 Tax=uncultured Veillonella sp. TaxID=159268 RepID=UPI0026069029|nr:hypothetical protein [uncultured Veillonella sp.]
MKLVLLCGTMVKDKKEIKKLKLGVDEILVNGYTNKVAVNENENKLLSLCIRFLEM